MSLTNGIMFSILCRKVKLNEKQVLEIALKVLREVKKVEEFEGIDNLIEELEFEIEYYEDNEAYLEISIYTKGLASEAIKTEILFVDTEYDSIMGIEINNKKDEETEINILMNEENTKVSEAQKPATISIVEENENKGTIKVAIEIEEGTSIIVKIGYSIDDKAKKMNIEALPFVALNGREIASIVFWADVELKN